jgi:hypothetical protein
MVDAATVVVAAAAATTAAGEDGGNWLGAGLQACIRSHFVFR